MPHGRVDLPAATKPAARRRHKRQKGRSADAKAVAAQRGKASSAEEGSEAGSAGATGKADLLPDSMEPMGQRQSDRAVADDLPTGICLRLLHDREP